MLAPSQLGSARDAWALPFEDARFDRVISTFGVMFAVDQRQAAAGLARAVSPMAWGQPEAVQGLLGRDFELASSTASARPTTREWTASGTGTRGVWSGAAALGRRGSKLAACTE